MGGGIEKQKIHQMQKDRDRVKKTGTFCIIALLIEKLEE